MSVFFNLTEKSKLPWKIRNLLESSPDTGSAEGQPERAGDRSVTKKEGVGFWVTYVWAWLPAVPCLVWGAWQSRSLPLSDSVSSLANRNKKKV